MSENINRKAAEQPEWAVAFESGNKEIAEYVTDYKQE